MSIEFSALYNYHCEKGVRGFDFRTIGNDTRGDYEPFYTESGRPVWLMLDKRHVCLHEYVNWINDFHHYLHAWVFLDSFNAAVRTYAAGEIVPYPDFFAGSFVRCVINYFLENNIPLARWHAMWKPNSVNTIAYHQNLANGWDHENAALNTWTGRIAQEFGFNRVGPPETVDSDLEIDFWR